MKEQTLLNRGGTPSFSLPAVSCSSWPVRLDFSPSQKQQPVSNVIQGITQPLQTLDFHSGNHSKELVGVTEYSLGVSLRGTGKAGLVSSVVAPFQTKKKYSSRVPANKQQLVPKG